MKIQIESKCACVHSIDGIYYYESMQNVHPHKIIYKYKKHICVALELVMIKSQSLLTIRVCNDWLTM